MTELSFPAAGRFRAVAAPLLLSAVLTLGAFGYLATDHALLPPLAAVVLGSVFGVISAAVVTRLAVAMARLQPEHDPEDPRYMHQGRVGVVTAAIPAGGNGAIRFENVLGHTETLAAREVADGAIPSGEEICIERIEAGVAHVERWTAVEHRL